ncbi:hypothetical protein MPLA_1560006 [Mesorhizobium sp. ORS 3359]|nr:hypothetical protein MPLA_1560006 [Mesorhizobium sp. ORS 3359]
MGKLLHPCQSCGLPAASRLGQIPVVASAVMHSRMVKPPAEKRGCQRFTLIGERSSKTFRSPGRKCPNGEIYYTET